MESVGGINSGREASRVGPLLADASEARRATHNKPGPRNLVARMTAPLMAALAGRYDDSFVRDGQAAVAAPRKGLLKILAELPGNIADWLGNAWNSLFRLSGGDSTWLTSDSASLREFGETLWNNTHKLLRAGREQLGKLWESMKGGLSYAWEKAKAAASWVAQQARAVTQWIVAAISKAFSVFTRSKAEDEKRQQEEAAYQKKYEARKAQERRDDARRAEDVAQDKTQQARRQAVSDAAAVAALATDQVKAPPPGAEKHQLVDNATLARRRARRLLTGSLPA